MDGRANTKIGFFEIFYKNHWVILDVDNWDFAREKISTRFLIILYYNSDKIFKEKALIEFKCRVRRESDFNLLWMFFLSADRFFGDMALEEIYKRSGSRYVLPKDRNR